MLNVEERMSNPLKVIGLCKDKVGTILMLNDDVVNLVMPTLDNEDFSTEQNWFGCKIEQNVNGEKKNIHLIGHCKDTPYFDETITDTRAMIWMEAFIRKISTSIMNVSLAINVTCHKDIIPFSSEEKRYWKSKGYAGNRVDAICMAVYNALTDSDVIRNFGIGKMDFDYGTQQLSSFKPNFTFYGRSMTFLIDEISLSQFLGEQ